MKLFTMLGIVSLPFLVSPAFAEQGIVVATHLSTGGCFYFQVAGQPNNYYGMRVDGTQTIQGTTVVPGAVAGDLDTVFNNALIGAPIGFDIVSPTTPTFQCQAAVGMPAVTVQIVTNLNQPPAPTQ